jgi:hypothetical protein
MMLLSQNTSYGWKKFLGDYPNYDEAAAIRKKIIRLEVDEISETEKLVKSFFQPIQFELFIKLIRCYNK